MTLFQMRLISKYHERFKWRKWVKITDLSLIFQIMKDQSLGSTSDFVRSCSRHWLLNFSEISQIQNKTFYWKRKFLTKILLYMKIILYIHIYFPEFYALSSDINHFRWHQFYSSLLKSNMNFSLFLFFILNFYFWKL